MSDLSNPPNANNKNYAKNEINRFIKIFRESSFTKQLSLGTATGWCTGAIIRRVGKPVAFTIGSGILLYEIAQYNGFIKTDWDKLKEKVEKKSSALQYVQKKHVVFNKVRTFARTNKVFAVGFIGGFFLGVAS